MSRLLSCPECDRLREESAALQRECDALRAVCQRLHVQQLELKASLAQLRLHTLRLEKLTRDLEPTRPEKTLPGWVIGVLAIVAATLGYYLAPAALTLTAIN